MKNYSYEHVDSEVQQHYFLSEELLVPRKVNDTQRTVIVHQGINIINLKPIGEPSNVYSNEYRRNSTSEIN